MINPWTILGAVLFLGASHSFVAWKAYGAGQNAEIVKQESDEALMRKTREAAQLGAADAIAGIKITSTTINREIQTLVRTDVVYRDCRHAPDVLRLLEALRTGTGSDSAAISQLRNAATPDGRYLRSDDTRVRGTPAVAPGVLGGARDQAVTNDRSRK